MVLNLNGISSLGLCEMPIESESPPPRNLSSIERRMF